MMEGINKKVRIMKQLRIPIGLNATQWQAMIEGLDENSTTINDYRKVLNLLHSYENGMYHILSMDKEDAKAYYAYLDTRVQDQTMSANTAHRYKATLRSLGMRIMKQSEQFPNYQNPFTNLVKNEYRKPTSYEKVSFANPEAIQQIRKQYYTLRTHEVFILEFMLNLGLTPKQIEQIRISDFKKTDKGLLLCVKDANQKNAYYGFYPTFEKELLKYQPNLGDQSQDTYFFVTSRHLPYNYRAIHHMVQNISKEARLAEPLTPYQLSLYGMVHSYLIHASILEHTMLDQELAKEMDPEKQASLKKEIEKNESLFIPLAQKSWIGDWQSNYPSLMQKQIDAIHEQLGGKVLLGIVGLNHD